MMKFGRNRANSCSTWSAKPFAVEYAGSLMTKSRQNSAPSCCSMLEYTSSNVEREIENLDSVHAQKQLFLLRSKLSSRMGAADSMQHTGSLREARRQALSCVLYLSDLI